MIGTRTTMESTCLTLLVLCISTCAGQRIQLGGTGPRPVGLGQQPAPGPSFSQQLNFGQAQPQFQYQQAQPQYIQQQPQPQQAQTVRQRAPAPQAYQQQQQPHPQPLILQQQGQPGSSNFPPIGSFPIPANARQPVLLRSPQQQVTTTAAASDDEYEDEEYNEEPQQQLRLQPQPLNLRAQAQQVTTRPVQPQRAPVRIQHQAYNPQAGPQRFVVPQQQQVSQQQQRRPVQQQRPIQQQAPVQQAYQPQQQVRQQSRPGQDSRLAPDSKDRATPPPVQTVDRYMRTNDDGSTSWGYTNEDGTFKEETIGADCVVRGKYGYVDPDGVKREYEYQSGNPCDPNKRGQPEEDDEEELVVRGRPGSLESQQRLGGLLNARPVQYQQQPQQQQLRQRQIQLQQ